MWLCVCISGIMTHASVPREEREQLGISDNFVRLSVGLEDSEDLIADLDQAFQAAVSFTHLHYFAVSSGTIQ